MSATNVFHDLETHLAVMRLSQPAAYDELFVDLGRLIASLQGVKKIADAHAMFFTSLPYTMDLMDSAQVFRKMLVVEQPELLSQIVQIWDVIFPEQKADSKEVKLLNSIKLASVDFRAILRGLENTSRVWTIKAPPMSTMRLATSSSAERTPLNEIINATTEFVNKTTLHCRHSVPHSSQRYGCRTMMDTRTGG